MALSKAQIDQFHNQGYLVIDNLLDAQRLASIKAEYATVMDGLYQGWAEEGLVPPATSDMDFWAKLSRCFTGNFDWYQPFDISLPHHGITEQTEMHFGSAVFDMITHDKILDVVESLIGSEISSNPIQHVRIKPPRHLVRQDETRAHITATDWHQDMGVTLPEADETKFITIWLAITDATTQNGCLQVASGTHDTMLPHCGRAQVGLAEPFVPQSDIVPLPVKAGGAVIFHPFTPHSSLDNVSSEFRWSFDLRYHITGQPSGRSQFPEFVARSKARPETELRDWRQWQKMWQETRAELARSSHIPQHRWDSDAPFCA